MCANLMCGVAPDLVPSRELPNESKGLRFTMSGRHVVKKTQEIVSGDPVIKNVKWIDKCITS